MTGGKERKKILIKSVNWVGDAIFMTPVISALRKKFPESHIALLVKPRVKDLYRENPDVNELIVYDGKEAGSFARRWAFFRELRKKKFDLGIVIQPASYEAAFMLFFGGVRERIGYSHYLRDFMLTKTVKPSKEVKHEVDVYLGVLEPLGIKPAEKKLVLNTDSESEEWAEGFLRDNSISSDGILVGLNPGAYSPAKRWFEDRYAELADRIIGECGGKVIVFSGPGNEDIARKVVSLAKNKLILGETSLLQLAALSRKCKVVVSNCTGPAHVAAAVGTPVIVLVGTNDPNRTRPYGEGHISIKKQMACSPCFLKECDDMKCMKTITVDEVFEEVKKRLV